MSEAQEKNIYLGRHGQPGEQPYFDFERVREFYTAINARLLNKKLEFRPQFEPYDEHEVTALLNIAVDFGEYDKYDAEKGTTLVVRYLQGMTNRSNVHESNKEFTDKEREVAWLSVGPHRAKSEGIAAKVNDAITTIADALNDNTYTRIKQLKPAPPLPRPAYVPVTFKVGEVAKLKETEKPLSPHARITREYIQLCDLTAGEATSFYYLLDPANDSRSITITKQTAALKIRERIDAALLSYPGALLEIEAKRVYMLLNLAHPRSLFWQAHGHTVDGGSNSAVVRHELYQGLWKCINLIKSQ